MTVPFCPGNLMMQVGSVASLVLRETFLHASGAEVCISTEDFSATAIGWRQTGAELYGAYSINKSSRRLSFGVGLTCILVPGVWGDTAFSTLSYEFVAG
eukprot:scaffold154766_cov17-Tisochrysis_lutea.AAC.1